MGKRGPKQREPGEAKRITLVLYPSEVKAIDKRAKREKMKRTEYLRACALGEI